MFLAPVSLVNNTLPPEILEQDVKSCRKAGPCGVGKKALYIGARFLDRHYYLPWPAVKRVFKRVAMSPGGFSGKGLFGSIAFLVVQYGNGEEKACRFKYEADVDRLLLAVSSDHPEIPVHSKKAEEKLAQAKAEEEARYHMPLSPDAEAAVAKLRFERSFLEEKNTLSDLLTAAAKQKRIIDNMGPGFRIGGALVGILGLLLAAYGLIGLFARFSYALYFLIGGGALFFLTLSTNTFPSRWNSPKTAEADWEKAVSDMRDYLSGKPDFSVPPQYAHPVVLTRMIRVIREGRAENAKDALALVKQDLKALNSSVKVSQKEYDEVTAVKPLFLVCGYRDN